MMLTAVAHAAPVRLRCEYLENPLGLDSPKPHLSWQTENAERNWRQSAYQILVASSADRLRAGNADVWDSGKGRVRRVGGIVYGGSKLESRKRYFWRVRVWDAGGQVSQSASTAWWETALDRQDGWKAKWISWKNPEEAEDRAAIRWVWVAGQDALHAPVKSAALVSRGCGRG